MSCPYLEKGRIARCHAFGSEGLGVESSEFEEVCFSGEFGECSFFSIPVLPGNRRAIRRQDFNPKPSKSEL